MTPEEFVSQVLDPAITWCQGISGWHIPFDDRARVLLTAISGQEANWTEHIQGGPSPAAHGLYQFERLGGVLGVLGGDTTWRLAVAACKAAGLQPQSTVIWNAFKDPVNDHLATAFARLLLWSDPAPLPEIGDEEAAWEYYDRNWRPGAPSRKRWSAVYPQAVAAIKAEDIP